MRKTHVFLILLLLLKGYMMSAQKIHPLNQMEQVRQIKQNQNGQIYLFSDYKACVYGTEGIESDCFDFKEKIKDFLGIDKSYSALAIKNILMLYKEKSLIRKIQLPEEINSLAYANQKIFIGTSGRGLYIYSLKNNHLDSIPSKNGSFINDLEVLDSNLWLAMDHGITIYSIDSLRPIVDIALPNQLVNRLLESDRNEIYAFGEFGDLYLFDSMGNKVNHRQFPFDVVDASSSNGSTFVLTKDACFELKDNLQLEKILDGKYSAVCVLENQLLLAKDNSILYKDITQKVIPLDDNCLSIYAESNSSFWAGGQGKVYHFINDSLVQSIILPIKNSASLSVSSLYVSEKYLFAGTMGEGLFVFDRNGKFIEQLLIKVDNNQRNIIQMQANSNTLWIAYLNGVISLDMNSLMIANKYAAIIGNNYLYCLEVQDSNGFYVGTSVHGMIHYKDGILEHYLKDKTIYSIGKIGSSLIISTENDGIYSLHKNSGISKINDLNKVFSTSAIGSQLLIARENEIVLYHLKNHNQFVLPNVGLKNMQFNSFSSSEDYFFIGFENGILKLDKQKLKKLGNLQVYMQPPKLFDQSISIERSSFDYEENTFTFTYKSFNYYKAENTIYKYRLLGLDSTWQSTGQEFVNYYNLPYGEYTFEVAAGTSENFVPFKTSQYSFTIGKPFWLQPLFMISAALLLGIAIYLFVKIREKGILEKSKVEQEHLRFEFDQLKSQVDPHFLFNSLNSIIDLIEEDQEMAVEAVIKLSNVYRSILEYANVDTVDLKTELRLAEQYFEIHKLRYQHLIELKIQNSTAKSDFRLVPLSCQFLIENAIKHNQISKNKKLIVSIYQENTYLVVKNNLNKKELSVPSTTLGLINLKRRYAQLSKKEVEIIDDGETFIVKLPLIYG